MHGCIYNFHRHIATHLRGAHVQVRAEHRKVEVADLREQNVGRVQRQLALVAGRGASRCRRRVGLFRAALLLADARAKAE